ncbi:MAG TPA: hypothetical protein PK445_03620 [Methanolinea sp.]|nr:hypothetical protein [Methanolinea sp.]HPC55155.1 hypothetical protein [Methanolinea sp.]HQE85190.1 hypothetical protein [Methanolinea sp.]HQJ18294.1 hypothetical protein [Methanolinea sp.]HRS92429.1 hypothetical protein [Methanolinea sp.]
MKEPTFLIGFDKFFEVAGKSDQSYYIHNYLKSKLEPKSIFIEENYIDKDYLIDFSKFYARSFNIDKKFTTRLHFFNESIENKEFYEGLKNFNKDFHDKLKKAYLGFTVIKPIMDRENQPFIGRTLLRTWPRDDNGELREYLTNTFHVSLYGIDLSIDSLPFQSQDEAVGGCATTACWTALYPLSKQFETPKLSPVEVTETSISFPTLERNFPSKGLTLHQMKSQFNALGLETEFINVEKIQTNRKDVSIDDFIGNAIKAYLDYGIPIIGALKLKKEGRPDPEKHAVVISGYRHRDGKITELYIHDDAIGPYCKTKLKESICNWENEWITEKKYSEINLQMLLIPIYHKMRLSYIKIYRVFLRNQRMIEERKKEREMKDEYSHELKLVKLNDYKRFLLDKQFNKKKDFLCKNYPRFIWIHRIKSNGQLYIDKLYDGTSVYPSEIGVIDYN